MMAYDDSMYVSWHGINPMYVNPEIFKPKHLMLRYVVLCPECLGSYHVGARITHSTSMSSLKHPSNNCGRVNNPLDLFAREIKFHVTDNIKTKDPGKGIALIHLIPPRCICDHVYQAQRVHDIRVTFFHTDEYSCHKQLTLPIAQFTVWI